MRTIKPFPIDQDDLHALRALRARIMYGVEMVKLSYRVDTPCWIPSSLWEDGKGFKKIKVKGRGIYIHRAMYEIDVGAVPEGHVLDHKCRVRKCCNPTHLDPVTTRVNTERGNGAWVFGQGAQTGRFSGAAPNGDGGCLGQQAARMDVYTHPEQFLPRNGVNESDPRLTAAAPAPIVGESWVQADPHSFAVGFGTKHEQFSIVIDQGEVCVKRVVEPTFCERHKLEGWLPRNVARAVNWIRGRA